MVGIGKFRVDHLGEGHGNVRRYEETVDREDVLPFVVRTVGVAATRNRVVGVERSDETRASAVQNPFWKRLCPSVFNVAFAEINRTVAENILVEVAAGDAVVALCVFGVDVVKDQFELLGRDLAVGSVSRKVEIVKHQFFAVGRGNPGLGIAAVKVEDLHNARFHRQFHALGGGHGEGRKRKNTALGRAVRTEDRIEEVRGIVVLGEDAGFAVKGKVFALVEPITAGRPDIHLLNEAEVGVAAFHKGFDVGKVGLQTVFGPSAGLCSAVHEEPVIGFVSTEADVVGKDRIGLPDVDRPGGQLRGGKCLVPDAVIVDEDVGEIPADHEDQHQERNQ